MSKPTAEELNTLMQRESLAWRRLLKARSRNYVEMTGTGTQEQRRNYAIAHTEAEQRAHEKARIAALIAEYEMTGTITGALFAGRVH